MTSVAEEETIKTAPSSTDVHPSPQEIGAPYGRFSTDCIVAGTSIASTVGTISSHLAATSNVHGVAGNVVGTNDTQTLTGKTINSGSNVLAITSAPYVGVNINTMISRPYACHTTGSTLSGVATTIVGIGWFAVNYTVNTSVLFGFINQPVQTLQYTASFSAPYMINYSVYITSAAASSTYSFTVALNGTILPTLVTVTKTGAAGDANVTGSGIISLTTSDQLQLVISGAVSAPIAASVQLNVFRIG